MKLHFSTLAGALLLSMAGSAGAQTDISTCGQTVTGSARLIADLNCVEADQFAVRIMKGELDLNGHTISGYDGVTCDRACTVVGPGLITGTIGSAAVSAGRKVTVIGVDITNSQFGVHSNRSATVIDSSVIDSSGEGIRASRKVTVSGSTVTGNSWAVRTHRASIDTSTITGNASGVLVYRKVDAAFSTITGNGEYDIRSGVKPSLDTTDCGVSQKWDSMETWGVCALD